MSYKLITCILFGHKARNIIEVLAKEKGIVTADKSTARGTSILNVSGEEMEVITVLVETKRADEIFEFLYFEGELNKPHHGMIYQERVKRASKYSLPKEEEKKEEESS